MHLSCPTWSFGTQHVTGHLSMEGALGVVSALGFETTEVGFSHLQPALVAARPQAEADRLRRSLDRTSLEIIDLFPWFATSMTMPPFSWRNCSLNMPDGGVRHEVLRLFEAVVLLAVAVDCPGITVVAGPVHDEIGPERSFDVARMMLVEMVARAHQHGKRLSIEPGLRTVTDSPKSALAMVEAVPGLEITLDYSHFISGGHDPAEGDVLIPYTRRVDARQANRDRVQCRFEDGELDFPRIVRALQKAGFSGTISTEYVCVDYQGCNDLDVITETLKMKRYLEGLLTEVFPVGAVAS